MARRKIKFDASKLEATPASPDRDEWQLKDDADRIKRYAELKGQSSRFKAALDHVKNEHQSVLSLEDKDPSSRKNPRGLARAGRKRSMKRAMSRG